jgi:hypothetical protein
MKLPKRLSLTFLGFLKASLNRNSVEQAGKKRQRPDRRSLHTARSLQRPRDTRPSDFIILWKYHYCSLASSDTSAIQNVYAGPGKEKAGLRSSVCAPSSVTTLLVKRERGSVCEDFDVIIDRPFSLHSPCWTLCFRVGSRNESKKTSMR